MSRIDHAFLRRRIQVTNRIVLGASVSTSSRLRRSMARNPWFPVRSGHSTTISSRTVILLYGMNPGPQITVRALFEIPEPTSPTLRAQPIMHGLFP